VKIACIMMQKNEILLLDPWIKYHSSLLGSEHIYVYDNGSSDAAVIQTLRDAEKSGVNVFWDYTRQEDFLHNREALTAGLIRRLDEEDPYDFYFPIDCDEFLACVTPDGNASCQTKDITEALSPYLLAKEVLVISHKYWNNLLFPNLYAISTSSKKCFFARGTCQSLDHGFHHARTWQGNDECKTSIAFFEFHYRTYAYHRSTNKQKLIGLVPDFSRKALRDYAKKRSDNFHCAQELLQSKYEYLRGFLDSSELVAAPVLLATFDALGIGYANLFERRGAISGTWGKSTLMLRHEVSRRLAFLTDWWPRLYIRVAGGLKRAVRRIATLLRG
jgi:hypothetical protein